MTHRAYKNEYNEEFLRQIINGRIKGLTATGEESEQVIIIAGELDDLQKFAALMYATPEQIKAVFSDFLTEQDVENIWKRAFSKAFEAVRDAMNEAACEDFGTGYMNKKVQLDLMGIRVDMYDAVRKF